MPRFRKRPIEIEARQFHGDNWPDICGWCGGTYRQIPSSLGQRAMDCVVLMTVDGKMRIEPGDWILKLPDGGWHFCAPERFEEIFEEVQ